MFLHWSQEFLFQLIPQSLQERFPAALVDPHYASNDPIPHVHGITGSVIGAVTTPVITRVSRRKLRDLLATDQKSAIKVRTPNLGGRVAADTATLVWEASDID